jgi:hypothetical protein
VIGTNSIPAPGVGFTTSEVDAPWLKEPLVPVTLTANMPIIEFAAGVMVRVVEPGPDSDVGLKLAEAPDGRPVTLSEMVPLKPFTPAAVTVYWALLPAMALPTEGEMPSEKSGGGPVMVSVVDPAWFKDPLVPVALKLISPVDAPEVVLIVSVVEPEPVTDVGLKLPDAPEGNPETAKSIVPLKPPVAVVVTV